MDINKLTLKPAIKIKTKGGRRYIQIITANGALIHIGPASEVDNWRVALRALYDEYITTFTNEKNMWVSSVIKEERLPIEAIFPIPEGHPKWMKYSEKHDKQNDKRIQEIQNLEKEFGVKLTDTEWILRIGVNKKRRKERESRRKIETQKVFNPDT
jgi:hypothetical protein